MKKNDNINDLVRKMEPRRYTRPEAARLLGKDPSTLKRWKTKGLIVPSETKWFGELEVDLYTDDDIRTMKALMHGRQRVRAAAIAG